jgi:hypothetical protein
MTEKSVLLLHQNENLFAESSATLKHTSNTSLLVNTFRKKYSKWLK